MKFETRNLLKQAAQSIREGNIGQAHEYINQVLISPDNDAEAYLELGKLYIVLGNYPLASVYVRQSFDMEKSVETLELLARANYLAEKYDMVAIEYEELIKHTPKREYYEFCMKAYEKKDYYEESIRIAKMYNYAVGDVSTYAELLIRYIVAGMEEDAKITAEEMQKLFPNNAHTYNMLGLYEECINNDYDKAKEYFKKSATSGNKKAYYNLGVCCKQSEDFENAEKYLSKLKSIADEVDKNYNYTLGTLYFSERKLRLGYKYYSKREVVHKQKEAYKDCLWDGKSYPKETLYINMEQGFGDNIMFARYLQFLTGKFKKIYIGTYPALLSLFKHNFETEKYPNLEIVSVEERVKFNKYALMTDLPYLLHKTFHNIPSEESYIEASERNVELIRKNVFAKDKNLKIGLCWRAKGMGLRDAVYRTIDAPYYFKPIMDLPDVSYYSFQFGDIFDMCKKYPQITDLTNHINDFADTAGALKNIDILITVDTALAHLAGAMGVKTYLLLCHAPDWRWFDNDKKTEWYPSVTIIKQQDRKTWEDVSEKLTKYIKKEVKNHTQKHEKT